MSESHSEHWRNPETGQVECECCCKWALDYAALQQSLTEALSQVVRWTAQANQYEQALIACRGECERLQLLISADKSTIVKYAAQLQLENTRLKAPVGEREWADAQTLARSIYLTNAERATQIIAARSEGQKGR